MRRLRAISRDDGYYHVVSRISSRRFLITEEERSVLYRFIRRAARFCGVDVLTFALMGNHIHLLIRVPKNRDISYPELVWRMNALYGDKKTEEIISQWGKWDKVDPSRERSQNAQKALKKRMYSLPQFCKTFKEVYAMNYNARNRHETSIWAGQRYKSVMLAPDYRAIMTVASYIDMNPVRGKAASSPALCKMNAFGAALAGDGFAQEAISNLISAATGRRTKWLDAARFYAKRLNCEIPAQLLSSPNVIAEGGTPYTTPDQPSGIPEDKAEFNEIPIRAIRLKCRNINDSFIIGDTAFVVREMSRTTNRPDIRLYPVPLFSAGQLVTPVRIRGNDSGYGRNAHVRQIICKTRKRAQ